MEQMFVCVEAKDSPNVTVGCALLFTKTGLEKLQEIHPEHCYWVMSFLKLSCLLSRSYLKANKYTGRAEQLMNGVFPFQKRKKLFFGPTKHGSGRWKVDSKISQELDNNEMPVR